MQHKLCRLLALPSHSTRIQIVHYIGEIDYSVSPKLVLDELRYKI